MNELEILRKLSTAAKREKVPELDVSRRVIANLSMQAPQADRSLVWIAGLAVAVALPVSFMAFHALDFLTDPLVQVLMGFKWVTL